MSLLRDIRKAIAQPDQPKWIIEHEVKFWNGSRFVRDRRTAITFTTSTEAFDYIDDNFNDEIAEYCDLEQVRSIS